MIKRSITDKQIGLIKAMLARGMKNCDIQFYFNRQDRPVNSGRITQIKGDTYGPEVTAALETELDAFLAGFAPSTVGAVISSPASPAPPPTLAERARGLFEHRGRSGWFLQSHETDSTECKEGFCLKPENRFADPLRSIAGLANNEGGFVFFGVKELPDGSLSVAGLPNDNFAQADPADVNRCLAGALDPVPRFSMGMLDFDGKSVGFIHVEKHDHPPIIATKNVNTEVKEGAIYYRYVGESRAIKPGELRQIIAFREQKAIAEFVSRMSKVAGGSAAMLDLDTGKVEGQRRSLLIDEALLPKLQFIREGEFQESAGAPTLRLIGDVVATKGGGPVRTVRSNVTDEAVLLNFLKQEAVAEPMQYLFHSAHTGRGWLPLFYYAYATQKPLAEVAAVLGRENATYRKNRNAAVKRLSGNGEAAFHAATGTSKAILDDILRGSLTEPKTLADVGPLALAVQGLPSSIKQDVGKVRAALLTAYELTRGDGQRQRNMRSAVYRAACRLDELMFFPRPKGKAK